MQQTRPVQTATLQQFLLWFVLCAHLHTVFYTHLAWLPNTFLHGFMHRYPFWRQFLHSFPFSLLSDQPLQLGRTFLISAFTAFLGTLLRCLTATTSGRRDPSWLRAERAYSFRKEGMECGMASHTAPQKLVIWGCGLSCDPKGSLTTAWPSGLYLQLSPTY